MRCPKDESLRTVPSEDMRNATTAAGGTQPPTSQADHRHVVGVVAVALDAKSGGE